MINNKLARGSLPEKDRNKIGDKIDENQRVGYNITVAGGDDEREISFSFARARRTIEEEWERRRPMLTSTSGVITCSQIEENE